MSALPGELRVVPDVPTAFAQAVVSAYRERTDNRFTLVLSGGDTARRCYQQLAGTDGIDWPDVDLYMGDERCVGPDDPDANQRLVHESLLDRVGPVGSFHPMRCGERHGDEPGGADAYDDELRSLLGAGRHLDLVHLGFGPDGHTASLFPGSEALEAPPDRYVVTNVDPGGANRHVRMTLTYRAIALARLLVVTVAGASKRAAFTALLGGADLPAARLRAWRVLWLVDAEASGAMEA